MPEKNMLTGGLHLSVVKKKEKKKKRERKRFGCARCWASGWLGSFWAGPIPGSAQRLPFSNFFVLKLSHFLFLLFFCRFCIMHPNKVKPLS
jgi:hypothetical protein